MSSKGDTQISNTKYLKCSEKDYGIQTGIEGDGDPFSITVENFLVKFKVSLLILEEGS